MVAIAFAILISGCSALNGKFYLNATVSRPFDEEKRLIWYFSSLVDVMAGVTSLTMTWDARLAEGTQLGFQVQNALFLRTANCPGDRGRKVIDDLPPSTTYRVTIYQVMHNSALLPREVIFSGTVRMANVSESIVLI